ncbi:MAG: DUF6044 family protein [Tuberibacillus sp.]
MSKFERCKNYLRNEKYQVIIALFIIALWVSPYFILGENAHMRVQDNLDSNLAWYKVINQSGLLFGGIDAHISQIINGHLERNAIYSQFYGIIILFALFPPMIAYGLSQALTRYFAFLGLYLLLRKYVIKEETLGLVRVAASLAFALTPYWPSGMLSILGMPLALWAFLNIKNGDNSWKNWLTLTVLPFGSTFILGFFFFLSALGIWWLADAIKTKRFQPKFFFAIIYMTTIYLAIEYRLVASLLIPQEPTNRSEFLESKNNLLRTLRLIVKNYVWTHNQDQSVFCFVILPLSLTALGIVIAQKRWRQEKLFIWLHVLNLALSIWYAFWFYQGWQPIKDKISILNIYNFSRYHYLRPMIIYVLFALSLKIIWSLGRKGRRYAVICMLLQFIALIPFNEQIYYHTQPTYKQFFAENEFSKIKSYIGKPLDSYRVVSIGMHPDVAQYNGFYTLDTYNNFYPLWYKHDFRKIIAPELNKNASLKAYFDDWGGRCYIFVDELGKHYLFSKFSDQKIYHLNLNTQALKALGGDYVLSAVPIMNAKDNDLKLLKVFDDRDAWWRVYLYQVQ